MDINLFFLWVIENLNYYIFGNYCWDESILVGDLQECMFLCFNFDFIFLKNLSIGIWIQLSYVNWECVLNGGVLGGNFNIGNGGYNFVNIGIFLIIFLFYLIVID